MILVLFSAHIDLFIYGLNGFLSLSDLTVLADVQSEVVSK
jgi:hypothetical protein